MKYSFLAFAFALGCIGKQASAEQTDDAVFFQVTAQNTFNSVFGLPAPASRMVQNIEWQLSLEHANEFAGGQTNSQALQIDSERSLLNLRHKQRLSECWQGEVNLALVAYNGGVFDESIDRWHQFFNLPDANRDATDFNSISLLLENEGAEIHRIESPQSGIGDIQLTVQRALGCFATGDSTRAEPIVRLGVKLPTGDPDELRGSGAADLFADWQSGIRAYSNRLYSSVSLGALFLGDATEKFPDHRRAVVYGSLGAQFAFTHRWRFMAQLDAHSAMFDSDLTELGVPAVSLTAGFRYLTGRSYSLEFSISEDVAIDTAPDIVARFALSYRPSLVGR